MEEDRANHLAPSAASSTSSEHIPVSTLAQNKQKKRPTIIVKLGGGLITDKRKQCTARLDVIRKLALSLKTVVINKKITVILVHGAGSYGHLVAKKYCLSQGRVASIPESDQRSGVAIVHRDLGTLSKIIIAELGKQGIHCKLHSPRKWATGTGPTFIGDLSPFTAVTDAMPIVHMTHGDIVACAKPKMFGVLSGDDLMLRLARHVADSRTHKLLSVVFAMDVEGLLSAPPGTEDSTLLREWSRSAAPMFHGVHHSDIDVTGGVFLKAQRAADIASFVDRVWLLDGRQPTRLVEACEEGGRPVGTRVFE